MARAIELSRGVRGRTGSNPWVGAVLARDGAEVATGVTQPPPGPHAEADALSRVDAAGAELFVTLEPCAPFAGKRTPSCAQAIIDAGVSRVHVALQDPDSRVRGRGIAMLRAAGAEVTVGDGAGETAEVLRPYLKHRETGLSYLIAKFAASLDGKTATSTGDSKWITGEAAREFAHQQRAWVGAVMVGRGTAVADDPELTARPGGKLAKRQPLRIVVDSRGSVDPGGRLFRASGPVLVATSEASPVAWREGLEEAGAEVHVGETTGTGVDLADLMKMLGARGITSVWAEGGSGLLGTLYEAGLVDETWAFLAPKIIGGGGLSAVGGEGIEVVADAQRLRGVKLDLLGEDVLIRGYSGSWSPDLG
jgi:diaminohydroxyphosphoribosylaminopyrimidine deaminase / 5-amino-6-(5-phosphoribosylamino)uracil reductase